jgi:hypothetical protein
VRNLKFVIRSSIVLFATAILFNATPVFADYFGESTYF